MQRFIELAGAQELLENDANVDAASSALHEHIKQAYLRRKRMDDDDRRSVETHHMPSAPYIARRRFVNAVDALTQEVAVAVHRWTRATEALEERRAIFKRAISAPDNVALALHWVVTSSPMCETLGVDDIAAKQLRSLFGWCQGFAAAFAGGLQTMSEWFSAHGFEHKHRPEAQPKIAPGSALTVPVHIRSAFQSLHRKATWTHPTSVRVDDGLDGVQQVIVDFRTEDCVIAQQCVALLVKVPNLQLGSSGRAFGLQETGSGAAAGPDTGAARNAHLPTEGCNTTGIHLPTVEVGLDTLTVQDAAFDREVSYDTFVFTAPRVHFFLLCADLIGDTDNGVRLAGVHGAGKSTMLRAMASILSVGSPTDVWHLVGESVRQEDAAAAFISTSTGQMVQSHREPTGVQRRLRQSAPGQPIGSPSTNSTAPLFKLTSLKQPSLKSWLHDLYGGFPTHLRAPSQAEKLSTTGLSFKHLRTSGMKLTLFDEVNSMLQTQEDTEASRAVRSFLYWSGDALQPGCLKILASSPDGAREGNQAGYEPEFFELRPAPAEHMAAILLAAPQCFVGGTEAPREPEGHFEDMLQLCRKFGSNSRYLALVLQTAHSHAVNTQLDTTASASDWLVHMKESSLAVYGVYLGLLADRMIARLHHEQPPQPKTKRFSPSFRGDVQIPYMLRMNASLIVRSDPRRYRSQGELVGSISYDAQICVVDRLRSDDSSSWGKGLTATKAMALFEMDASDGSSFESAVRTRLYLGALCRQAVKLNQLHNIHSVYMSTAVDLRSPAKGIGHLQSSPLLLKTLWRFPQLNCKMPTVVTCESYGPNVRIPAAVYQWMVSAQPNDCLIIAPGDSFPYCDYLVVYKDKNGATQVVFIEATTSTLEKHSSSKKSYKMLLPTESAHSQPPAAAAAAGSAAVPSKGCETRSSDAVPSPESWRDFFLLVHKPKYFPEFNPLDKSWTLREGTGSGSGALSVGNAWLTVLGVPLRFCLECSAHRPFVKPTAKFRVTLEPTSDSSSKSGLEDCSKWGVAVLYISGQPLEEQGDTAAFSQLEVDCEFVYCMYKQHGDVLSSKILSGASSPVVTPPKARKSRKGRNARRKKNATRRGQQQQQQASPAPAAAAGSGTSSSR